MSKFSRQTTTSLDDLVEENDVGRSAAAYQDEDGEEDELEAYMATIEKESDKKVKESRQKSNDVGSDDGDEAGEIVSEEPVENLAADLAAAIAGANSSVNKTTKRLNQLSTKEVKYMPFRKDFYVEVPELTRLSDEDVKELRMSLENIKVVGKSCPKPITCWAHCGLSRKIMEVLKKLKFNSPTPIQAQAIPAIMSGRDVIGIAKTGCGKTLSFLLPMFRHILDQPKLERGDGPIAVVITPTRELATQICDDAQKFTRVLGLRVVAIYGGPNISEQIGVLKLGAEIVVCTPGRMIEILTVNSGRVTNLNRCTLLVLDEADRLFDMGFEKQIRSIVDLIRPDRQTVMFSATFPKIMEAHARRILTRPIEIQVGGRSVVCKDVQQHVEIIEEDDKFLRLLNILKNYVDEGASAIVFVSKQEKADSLLEDLMQAYDPNCLVLHGGIDKDDRISTFARFKSGQTKVLVATSVAARGLDVKNCICVVNYDCTNHYEDYVHRCGRTGRAGKKGFAFTFLTPEQGQFAADIIKALELSNSPVPPTLQKLWDDYKSDAEKLGKKIWTSSGFSGRGFKFDEAEQRMADEKKKHQKKSLGLQNSDDEDDDAAGDDADAEMDAATLESEIKNLVGGRADISKPVIKRIGSSSKQDVKKPKLDDNQSATVATNTAQRPESTKQINTKGLSKIELVRQRAAMLMNRKKGIEGADVFVPNTSDQASKNSDTQSLGAVASNPSESSAITAKQIAEQRAQALRAKLQGKQPAPSASHNIGFNARTSDSIESSAASTLLPATIQVNERLEMNFEINDYHQQVRRRLTSKDALAKISERCEVGITVRGQFCQPGDRPTQPKLHLNLEGGSPASLEKAHRELLLLVKDEYTRINTQPATKGRYRLL